MARREKEPGTLNISSSAKGCDTPWNEITHSTDLLCFNRLVVKEVAVIIIWRFLPAVTCVASTYAVDEN